MYISTLLSLTIPRAGFYTSPGANHRFHCPTAKTSCASLFISNFFFISGSKEEGRRYMWFNILLQVGSVLKSFDSVDHLPEQKHTITSAMLGVCFKQQPTEQDEGMRRGINSMNKACQVLSVCMGRRG